MTQLNLNNTAKIRLLLAEDSAGTRHNLINLLGFEPDIEIIGAVGTARQAASLVSLALCLAVFATTASAQQPTQAQISAVKSNCRSDYMQYCSSVPTGTPSCTLITAALVTSRFPSTRTMIGQGLPT